MGASAGRWPANLILDGSDEATAGMPESKGNNGIHGRMGGGRAGGIVGEHKERDYDFDGYADSGSAARFFACCEQDPQRYLYTSKASRRERDAGLEGPMVKLRADLLPEKRQEVMAELKRRGLVE